MTTTNSGCCGGCGNETTDCSCPVGERGSQIRFGDGVPSIISTDLAGDVYIQRDSTPLAGEVWSFNGVSWTDEGFSTQGDTGADGVSGAVVEYNTVGSPTVFNSVGLTTIDTQTISLETNGSYLEIENSTAVSVGDANNHTKITVGGVVVWENFPIIWGIANQEVCVRVTRVSSTLIEYQRYVRLSNIFTLPILAGIFYYNAATDGVADMDTNPLTVLLQWGGAGTSHNLTITKFVK